LAALLARAVSWRSSQRNCLCLQFIQDRLDEPLTVSQLADFCRISIPRFKAWFRNATGVPPREYLLRRKIEAASAQLKEGKKSVTEIA
jgi:AraC-like DNA-binding protein